MARHRSSQRYFEHGRLLELTSRESERLNADGDISDSADEVEVVVESQNTRPKNQNKVRLLISFELTNKEEK